MYPNQVNRYAYEFDREFMKRLGALGLDELTRAMVETVYRRSSVIALEVVIKGMEKDLAEMQKDPRR